MDSEDVGRKARQSSAFKRAQSRAEQYAGDPDKLNDLLGKASDKAASRSGPLGRVRERLMAAFRLIRAYANGSYREVPWSSLVMIIAAVIYFVMPFDFLPDFAIAIGLIDDVAILSWVLGTVSEDIDHFMQWERKQQGEDLQAQDEP